MSTRSGKRIHGSLHENTAIIDVDPALKSERKTRSKHTKENIEEHNKAIQKLKKRENYVSYPTDDEQAGDTGSFENEGNTRTLRKNALKEHNPVTTTEISDCEPPPKNVRSTRRTRKFAENATEVSENVEVKNNSEAKTKKSKKKKTSSEGHGETLKPKKKSKKKKGKRSNSFVTEDIVVENVNKSILSNDSFHSAAGSPRHEEMTQKDIEISNSDKSEPKLLNNVKEQLITEDLGSEENKPQCNKKTKKSKSLNKSIDKRNSVFEESNISVNKNGTFEIEAWKRLSSVKHSETDIINDVSSKKSIGNISLSNDTECNLSRIKNSTFDLEPQRLSTKTESPMKIVNTTYEKNTSADLNTSKARKRKSTVDAVHSPANLTATLEVSKETNIQSPLLNSTYETSDLNTSKSRKRKSTVDAVDSPKSLSATLEVSKETNTHSPLLNSTYDKSDISAKVNTTFDLDKNTSVNKKQSTIINTTYEKEIESPKAKKSRSGSFANSSNRKSVELTRNNSVVSALIANFESKSRSAEKLSNNFNKSVQLDATFGKDQKFNTTFDKVSKSSIISSDSNTDDISRISITSDESILEPKQEPAKQITIMNETPVLIDSSVDDSLISEDMTPEKPIPTVPTIPTPLRREGTFTKDGPDDLSKSDDPSPVVTPKKSLSSASPGNTPFPTKSLTKEKPSLNVTRSIEKSRKSEVEPAPRMTRVMFCSPVNNPMLVAQQKRMIIKSNLKGSNKSFVYEESDSISAVSKPGPRKRSYTHSEAEATRAKRKRLTEDMRQSADRLSRHRTSSANAKLTDSSTTPTKKTTPSKAKVSRTKLPNFAALHQKQFDKMESLDECQERKAKRAKQLLTPTPAVSLSEKSPKVAETQKDPPKKEVVKKVETPVKSFTQEASKPAYTRFGFKLNLDVNPFSIPSKTAVKPKENSSKLTRQATLPSLAGTTSIRREVAKQVVMREKSFTDKRQLKRNENRTIIKGVRTNRRFELQMKLRNIE